MRKVKMQMEERFLIDIYLKSQNGDFYISRGLYATQFIAELLQYLEVSDYMQNRSDLSCVQQLYLSPRNLSNLTQDKLCEELFIEEKTLYRQRKVYAKLIAYLIEKHMILFITDKKCS